MYTDEDRKRKNWRTAKRRLKKARRKVDRLMKKLNSGKFSEADLPKLKEDITDAKVRVSQLELQVGDAPE